MGLVEPCWALLSLARAQTTSLPQPPPHKRRIISRTQHRHNDDANTTLTFGAVGLVGPCALLGPVESCGALWGLVGPCGALLGLPTNDLPRALARLARPQTTPLPQPAFPQTTYHFSDTTSCSCRHNDDANTTFTFGAVVLGLVGPCALLGLVEPCGALCLVGPCGAFKGGGGVLGSSLVEPSRALWERFLNRSNFNFRFFDLSIFRTADFPIFVSRSSESDVPIYRFSYLAVALISQPYPAAASHLSCSDIGSEFYGADAICGVVSSSKIDRNFVLHSPSVWGGHFF